MGLHQEGVSAAMVSLLRLSAAPGNRTKTETPGEDRRLPMFERQENPTGGSFLSTARKITRTQINKYSLISSTGNFTLSALTRTEKHSEQIAQGQRSHFPEARSRLVRFLSHRQQQELAFAFPPWL